MSDSYGLIQKAKALIRLEQVENAKRETRETRHRKFLALQASVPDINT